MARLNSSRNLISQVHPTGERMAEDAQATIDVLIDSIPRRNEVIDAKGCATKY